MDTEEKKDRPQGTLLDDEVVSHEHVAVLAGMNETIVATLVALGDVRSLLDQQQHALGATTGPYYVRDQRVRAQGHSLRMQHDTNTKKTCSTCTGRLLPMQAQCKGVCASFSLRASMLAPRCRR